jgi:PTH1 family peptidyl-tRNA hydrolase
MYYVVALGNPGEKYEHTRHNVGFLMMDYVIKKLDLSEPTKSMAYSGRVTKGEIANQEMIFLYPETFMNHSGEAVKKLVPSDQVNNLIVIYDDVDLPLGKIKISQGRGDGGHNGIKSIISSLGDKDFIRLRVGIAPVNNETGLPVRPQGDELANFVLKNFTTNELNKLDESREKLFNLLETIVRDGVVKAMNVGNG